MVPPQSGSSDDAEAGNPTDFLLVLATLQIEQQAIGRKVAFIGDLSAYLRILMIVKIMMVLIEYRIVS